jgi:hypothetical protein
VLQTIFAAEMRNIDSMMRASTQHRLNEAALAALNAGAVVPAASSSVAGALGMKRPAQSDQR